MVVQICPLPERGSAVCKASNPRLLARATADHAGKCRCVCARPLRSQMAFAFDSASDRQVDDRPLKVFTFVPKG